MSHDPMTGLPAAKKKTSSKASQDERQQYLAEMRRCAECGDHKGAKGAAFRFIKSLPAGEPEMEYPVAGMSAATPPAKAPAKPASGLSPALRAYLSRAKK